jgi:putative nucleotidyltransferase with HDIG domain
MMDRLASLRQKVTELYQAKDPNRSDWTDWLFAHHVFVVVDNAKALAERYGANAELAQAAALLHDIADVKMKRFDTDFDAESLKIARELMKASGYRSDEVRLVVDDAIALHSCPGGQRPQSKEGLVLATADALAHFTTDYYTGATRLLAQEGMPAADIQAWVLKKTERDFAEKICFDDIREETRPSYEMSRTLFARSSAKEP